MALSDNLIAYWDLNEASGARADDSGNGYELTDNNTVGSRTINGVTGADFNDASTEFLSRANEASQLFDFSGDFSIAFWAVFDRTNTREQLVAINASGDAAWYFQYTGAGAFDFNQWTAYNGSVKNLRVTKSISASTPYFIVATWDSSTGTFELFFNAVSQGTDTDATVIGSPDGLCGADFSVGAGTEGTTYPFNGGMSRLGIWDKVLSSTEISLLYNGGAGVDADVIIADDVKNSPTLATSLVSYWELEETSGTRVDSHGSNPLTDNNTVGYRTGKQGNAADFVRANSEYLSATVGADFQYNGTTNRSISFWFYNDDVTNSLTLASLWYGVSATQDWLIYRVASDLRIGIRGNSNTMNYTVAANTWYHIVVTMDSSNNVELYINGSSVDTGTGGAAGGGSGVNFMLGYHASTYYFDGALDEVGFWTKVLSAAEVSALYNSGAGIPYDAGGGGYTGNIKSIAGVAQANIKSMAGITNANIKSVVGVTNS